MNKTIIILLFIAINCCSLCHGGDPFCDPSTIIGPTEEPFPDFDPKSMFKAIVQKKSLDNTQTKEVIEYFDGKKNVNVIHQSNGNSRTSIYLNRDKNEFLYIKDTECQAKNISDHFADIEEFEVAIVDGKKILLSPMNMIFSIPKSQFKIASLGYDLRGFDYKVWVACLKSKFESFKVEIFITDPNMFLSDLDEYDTYLKAIPLEIVLKTKNMVDSRIVTDSFSIFSFRPFQMLDEDDYFFPSGIYCPNRISDKQVPTIPETYIYYSQSVVPTDNNSLTGNVETIFVEYHIHHRLYGRTYNIGSDKYTAIFDYLTGLGYSINVNTGICEKFDLSKPNVILPTHNYSSQIDYNDPNQFFTLTDVEYQYVGTKKIDHSISTDVWLGKTKLNNYDAIVEWYFLSEKWLKKENFTGPEPPEPVVAPLMIKTYVYVPVAGNSSQYDIKKYTFHLYGYRQSPFNLDGYDLDKCNLDTDKKYFIFRLNNDLALEIKMNVDGFKEAVIDKIREKARITILRISRIEVVFDEDAIYVLFTLFERTKSYGTVTPAPLEDIPLNEAVKSLQKAFLNDEIQLEFTTSLGDDAFIIPVVKESLKEIGPYEEGFVEIQKEVVKKGFSTILVIILGAGMLLVGLVISLIIVKLHKANKINMPLLRKIYKV